MKTSGLIVAAAVLAALTGTLYWSDHRKPTETTSTASADTPPKILALKDGDISKIEIKKKGTEEVSLAKNEADHWTSSP